MRRGGRAVEGARLESVYTGNRIEGSNPSPSAIKFISWKRNHSVSSQSDGLFRLSLITLSFMVLGMVLIGGLTRLTGSGLSIVEWKPITGILPPLTPGEWILEFSKYQTSPEFQKINLGMTLDEFQSIFFLEYVHRLWGRLIGLVLFIPTLLMIFKKQHREMWHILALLWTLGLAQGLMGWIMVKSGLHQVPHVSPYRLSVHLLLGFMIFGAAFWMTLLLYKEKLKPESIYLLHKNLMSLQVCSLIALILMLLTALFGGFVAGLKAGLVYNTFPLMGNTWVPREFLTYSPWGRDFFENPVSVQFLHRIFAIITAFFCGGLWMYQRNLEMPPALSMAFNAMILCILLQVSLGIMTLVFQVPLTLALLHQGVAFILFGNLVYILFLISFGKPDKGSITI